jgi:hypothetical protein
LRWRLRFFDFLVKWNRKKQLVPRRRRFSLLKSDPTPIDPSIPAASGRAIPAVAEIQAGS